MTSETLANDTCPARDAVRGPDGHPGVGGRGPAEPSRRAFLTGAALTAGASAMVALGGCATYGSGPEPQDPGPAAGADDGDDGDDGLDESPEAGASTVLAKVADIPVGGGMVLEGRRLVLTQPKAGTVKAFTAVCTHQGCVVADVSNGTINCPCHGSRFHAADGTVASGPARRDLREIKVTVDGAEVKLG